MAEADQKFLRNVSHCAFIRMRWPLVKAACRERGKKEAMGMAEHMRGRRGKGLGFKGRRSPWILV